MKTFLEWTQSNHLETGDILASQLDQLIGRLEGLTFDLPKEEKSAMIENFVKQVEERLLK
jgi:hypothetical protein